MQWQLIRLGRYTNPQRRRRGPKCMALRGRWTSPSARRDDRARPTNDPPPRGRVPQARHPTAGATTTGARGPRAGRPSTHPGPPRWAARLDCPVLAGPPAGPNYLSVLTLEGGRPSAGHGGKSPSCTNTLGSRRLVALTSRAAAGRRAAGGTRLDTGQGRFVDAGVINRPTCSNPHCSCGRGRGLGQKKGSYT